MSYLRIHFQIQDHEILVQFFKKSLITLAITFNSLIHVEIIFVYCEVRIQQTGSEVKGLAVGTVKTTVAVGI